MARLMPAANHLDRLSIVPVGQSLKSTYRGVSPIVSRLAFEVGSTAGRVDRVFSHPAVTPEAMGRALFDLDRLIATAEELKAELAQGGRQ